jgi:hypothetical protein
MAQTEAQRIAAELAAVANRARERRIAKQVDKKFSNPKKK